LAWRGTYQTPDVVVDKSQKNILRSHGDTSADNTENGRWELIWDSKNDCQDQKHSGGLGCEMRDHGDVAELGMLFAHFGKQALKEPIEEISG
jgi:hypothetical protein